MTGAVKIINDLQNLFFPASCLCCKAILPYSDAFLCVECTHRLPLTEFTNRKDNPVERIFFGRHPIEEGTALLWYQKHTPVQDLLHQLKYRGNQKVGTHLGNWLGEEMKSSSRFKDIDLVIPMPLQRKKLRKRGYNQTDTFARTLARHLNAAYRKDLLLRTDRSGSLTRQGRAKRASEDQHRFEVSNKGFANYRHILLTDDVITTGTTLERAAMAIRESADIKISIATMAITY